MTDAAERRSVVALLVSVFCTSGAYLAVETALGKQVFDITRSELDLGWLGLAEFTPAALLVLVTGHVADRFDRRKVTACGIAVEAVGVLGLGWYASGTRHSIAPILALAVLLGIGRAFVAPASRSLPADMVAPERLTWLIPRFSATWQAAVIVGPVLGGVLYAVHPWMPFVAVTVFLAVGAVAVLTISLPPRERPPVTDQPSLHTALEGLRFIRSQPIIFGAIALDLFGVLFGGAIALLPAITEERLGAGAVGLGWLRAAGGIGAAIVTLSLARRPLARHVGRRLLLVVAIFGAGTVVLGATTSYVVAFLAMLVLQGADAVSVFIRATLVPLVTPEHMRGRVLAVENVFIGASNELGGFESGVVGQALGAAPAIVLGGAATLAIAGTWWFLFPALRDVDEFPTEPATTAVG